MRLTWRSVLVAGSLLLVAAAARPAAAQGAAEAALVKIGEHAPDFSLPGADGKSYHLAALRGRSNLVLVIFRGVW
jgi:cytochrome oxidase Cu insertion factor (SCO1/SenC/PrrC family)